MGVARRAEDFELDPVVVPISADAPEGSMADWLRSLVRDEAMDPGVSGADLVAEARAER